MKRLAPSTMRRGRCETTACLKRPRTGLRQAEWGATQPHWMPPRLWRFYVSRSEDAGGESGIGRLTSARFQLTQLQMPANVQMFRFVWVRIRLLRNVVQAAQ